MDSFNKVISFILGLVVVLVFFAVVTGRIKLGKFTPSFSKNVTPTPISTIKVEEVNQPNKVDSGTSDIGNNYKLQPTKTVSKPGSIPATGLPTLFIPSLLVGVFSGSFLRKAGKKQ